jgi:hypothetical protein
VGVAEREDSTVGADHPFEGEAVYSHYCVDGWAEVVLYQLGHANDLGNEGAYLKDVHGQWEGVGLGRRPGHPSDD